MTDNTTFPLTFTRTLQHLCLSTKVTAASLGIAASLLLPVVGIQQRGLGKLLASTVGVAVAAVGWQQYRDNKQLTSISADLGLVERKQSISWYSSLLSHKPSLTAQLQEQTTAIEEANVITNIVDYWQRQDKHLLVVGGTGSGKSFFIQALAAQLSGWKITVWDVDASIEDWRSLRDNNCTILETFADIQRALTDELELQEQRIIEGKQAGWSNYKQTVQPMLTVAEEFPALVHELDGGGDWLRSRAKRGRKPRMFFAIVTQNTTTVNLGTQGDSKIIDSCFVKVLLGSAAIDRAKQMKNQTLVDWLQTGDKYERCLCDDLPALRPQLQAQFASVTVTPGLLSVTPTAAEVTEVTRQDEEGENTAQTKVSEQVEPCNPLSSSAPNLSPELISHLRSLRQSGLSTQQILQQHLGQTKGNKWQEKIRWLDGLLDA